MVMSGGVVGLVGSKRAAASGSGTVWYNVQIFIRVKTIAYTASR